MGQPLVATGGQAFQGSLRLTTCTHAASLVATTDSSTQSLVATTDSSTPSCTRRLHGRMHAAF